MHLKMSSATTLVSQHAQIVEHVEIKEHTTKFAENQIVVQCQKFAWKSEEKKDSQMLICATFSYKFYLKLVWDECQRSQVNNGLGYGLVPYGIPRG